MAAALALGAAFLALGAILSSGKRLLLFRLRGGRLRRCIDRQIALLNVCLR